MPEPTVPTLYCFLERGFSGEEVEVRVGGSPVFRGPATTDLMMGFAEEFTAPLAPDDANLMEVRVPARGLSSRTPLPPSTRDLWIRIRLEAGELMVLIDTEPLGFL